MFGRNEDIIVVKKWLRYSDFKALISNERFETIDLSAFRCIGKTPEIKISANWIVINRVYIPKGMLFDFICVDYSTVTIQGYNEIRAFTLNGYEFIVLKVKRDQIPSFLNRMRKAVKEISGSVFNEYIIQSTPHARVFRQTCKKYLQDQKDFMAFLDISKEYKEFYVSHPMIAEDTLYIFMFFVDGYLTRGTKYYWKLNIQERKIFSPDGDTEVEFSVNAENDDYIHAAIRCGEKTKEIVALERSMVDFPDNTEINAASLKLCDDIKAMM